MKRLSSQLVWPHAVMEVFDAGSEIDITLSMAHSRLSLTRAQARRLAKALLKWADKESNA